MAYQSKYTGLQIDDILDSVEWKQGKIEDLASIRAGAQKGATALQSYTEKYTGTVTGIKINGVVKSGSGVIDLGTISTDISGKQDKLVDGVNIATINGQSLTAGGDLTIEGGADIIVANKSDLDELYKDVPEGTKAVVVNKVNDIRGVNLFDVLMGTIEGAEEVFTQPEAYTLIISSVDTNVELPISDTADIRVTLPFSNTVNIEMGSDLASIYRIFVASRDSDLAWSQGVWYEAYSFVSNSIPVSQLLTFDDNAIAGLTAISPVLIVDFVGTKTITEYIKNGDNWEVWSEGNPVLFDRLTKWASLISQTIPTKTSQLENDSDFITSEDVAAVALSGSYNDLQDTPTIPSAVTESTVSGWGFTKNAGTITGVSANGTSVATSGVANIPAASTSAYGVTKLNSSTSSTSTTEAATPSAVKAAYDLANSYKGTVTGVKINGATKSPTSGTVDIGNVVTSIKINGSTKTPSSGVVDLGTISGGGSSGGSGAYSEVNHGTSDTTFTLTPNTFHVWDEVSSLTLTLGSETSGVANEYLFQFTSGSTATTLSLPIDLKWTEELVIEPNMIYQVSILKGLASVLKFSNESPSVPIVFYVNDTPYDAMSNMTWNDFISSDYNVNGKFSLYGGKVRYSVNEDDEWPIYSSSVGYVAESDFIIPEHSYLAD